MCAGVKVNLVKCERGCHDSCEAALAVFHSLQMLSDGFLRFGCEPFAFYVAFFFFFLYGDSFSLYESVSVVKLTKSHLTFAFGLFFSQSVEAATTKRHTQHSTLTPCRPPTFNPPRTAKMLIRHFFLCVGAQMLNKRALMAGWAQRRIPSLACFPHSRINTTALLIFPNGTEKGSTWRFNAPSVGRPRQRGRSGNTRCQYWKYGTYIEGIERGVGGDVADR